MPSSDKIKKIFSIIARISISILLLIFLLRHVDEKATFAIIKQANPLLLLAAFLIFVLTYIMALYRWEMLLTAVQVQLSLRRIIISFSGSVFFNLFLPSTIGGDLVRSFDLATHTKKPKEIIASVVLDRLSGYAALVLVALVALFFGYRFIQDKAVLLTMGLICAVLILVLLVIFNKFFFNMINKLLNSPANSKLRTAIRDTHQEMHYFRRRKRILLQNLVYSLMIQVSGPLSIYLVALALGIRTEILYFFIFIPLIGAITLLPFSIGGLWLRDASTIYFFSKIGMVKDSAFAISLMVFIFTLLVGIMGGIIYVFTLHTRRLQYNQKI